MSSINFGGLGLATSETPAAAVNDTVTISEWQFTLPYTTTRRSSRVGRCELAVTNVSRPS